MVVETTKGLRPATMLTKTMKAVTAPEAVRQAHAARRCEPYNRAMDFDDYKVVLYRQDDGSWVAEIPAIGGCYALMDTREDALAELEQVFRAIALEYRERQQALPKDTTQVLNA